MKHISYLHREDLTREELYIIEEDEREDEKKSQIDSERCPLCGRVLRGLHELDEGYGAPMRIYVEYCDYCGYERR